MKLLADININSPATLINYHDSILLIGSCFTEHIGGRLAEHKFNVLQNPNGILFDPVSVCDSLESYIAPTHYTPNDLFYLDELWQSWRHHGIFSGMDQATVLHKINTSQQNAHTFLKEADWMIVTLGSAFTYHLKDGGSPVANCHRAPGQNFEKRLTSIDEINKRLDSTISKLKQFNPKLKIIFTISPVRHLRDGVVDNNRSKARLIEAVHTITEHYPHCYYFPAYELVIDVLRDYRFYDIDLAHPNYAATEFVFEKFRENYIEPSTQLQMEEVKKMVNAFKHKPFQPKTEAHKKFLHQSLLNSKKLQEQLPYLDFSEFIRFFEQEVNN